MLWAMALMLTNHHFFRACVLITLDGPRDTDYKSISSETLVVPQYKQFIFIVYPKPNFKCQRPEVGKQIFFVYFLRIQGESLSTRSRAEDTETKRSFITGI
ncbi:hypothetical protein FQA47_018199 [Oryzias melastigma]|uniref:Secreted protein n=1 Tax=Oryzias melastigma TaxID=30732 RepID=A0A834F8S3_ORYME|nr:hypothetical protein FQA47_018199 [Oryzias melastigma]